MKKEPEKQIVQEQIAPVLKALGKYETVLYPLSRMTSVRSTIMTLKTGSSVNYTTKKNNAMQLLEVTRIA